MAVTAALNRRNRDIFMGDYPVAAATTLYDGSAVGDNGAGYLRELQAGDPFRGFLEGTVNNATGLAGDKRGVVRKRGVIRLYIASAAITDVGKDVYASGGDTFTFTQSTNTRIGHVVAWESTGYVWVEFRAQVSDIAEVTDSTSGTADGTYATVATAVTGVDGSGSNAASKADVDARLVVINANFAETATKINEIIRRLGM